MGIEEIKDTVVAVTIKSVFGVSHKQAILDIEAGGFGIFQPDMFLPFRKPRIINEKIILIQIPLRFQFCEKFRGGRLIYSLDVDKIQGIKGSLGIDVEDNFHTSVN